MAKSTSAAEANSTTRLLEMLALHFKQNQPKTCIFAFGIVRSRRRYSGKSEAGKDWTKKVYEIEGPDGSRTLITDWNDIISPAVGETVMIPLRTTGNLVVFSHGGGEEF